MKLDVFDPAMCCSTGVCGPSIDPDLARFAGDLQWLAAEGVQVTRYNLASEPQAFADSQVATTALRERGDAALPLIVVDGLAVSFGVYPSRDALARWGGLRPVAVTIDAAGDGGCCGGGSSC